MVLECTKTRHPGCARSCQGSPQAFEVEAPCAVQALQADPASRERK